jgi:hypothetical protein
MRRLIPIVLAIFLTAPACDDRSYREIGAARSMCSPRSSDELPGPAIARLTPNRPAGRPPDRNRHAHRLITRKGQPGFRAGRHRRARVDGHPSALRCLRQEPRSPDRMRRTASHNGQPQVTAKANPPSKPSPECKKSASSAWPSRETCNSKRPRICSESRILSASCSAPICLSATGLSLQP